MCIKFVNYQDYTEMHGQQNIKTWYKRWENNLRNLDTVCTQFRKLGSFFFLLRNPRVKVDILKACYLYPAYRIFELQSLRLEMGSITDATRCCVETKARLWRHHRGFSVRALWVEQYINIVRTQTQREYLILSIIVRPSVCVCVCVCACCVLHTFGRQLTNYSSQKDKRANPSGRAV